MPASFRGSQNPDRYIRRVKNRFQVRPYDQITRERYDLGTFATIHDARRARDAFWWGKHPEVPRYTRRVNSRAGVYYIAAVCVGGVWHLRGRFDDRESAAKAARRLLRELVGRENVKRYLKLRGSYRRHRSPAQPGNRNNHNARVVSRECA